jgi:hypothetical protein
MSKVYCLDHYDLNSNSSSIPTWVGEGKCCICEKHSDVYQSFTVFKQKLISGEGMINALTESVYFNATGSSSSDPYDDTIIPKSSLDACKTI